MTTPTHATGKSWETKRDGNNANMLNNNNNNNNKSFK